MCPRYNKVLLYDVTSAGPPRPRGGNRTRWPAGRDRDGRRPPGGPGAHRPVTTSTWRPAGGRRSASTASLRAHRVPAGYYPDDLAVTPDGRFLIVLNSGQAEGDKKKPLPGIDVFQVTPESEGDRPRPIGHLSLEPEDDADSALRLGVGLAGSGHLAQGQAGRGHRPHRPGKPAPRGPDRARPGECPLCLVLSRRRLDHHADGSGIRSRGDFAVILTPRCLLRPAGRRLSRVHPPR